MAITLVGTATAQGVINGNPHTLSLPAGLQEGDVVYVFYTGTSQSAGGTESGGTWTLLRGAVFDDAGGRARSSVHRKVMGAVPDTSVTITGPGGSTNSSGTIAIAFRGVDTTTPEDQTVPTPANAASTNPNPPSIDTQTANAWVLVFAGMRGTLDAAVTAPTDYTARAHATADDNNDTTVSCATRTNAVASPATEDPASFTNWTTGDWHAWTIAIKPAGGSQTLVATTRTYSLAGVNTGLTKQWLLGATTRTYSLAGNDATLAKGYQVITETGAYTVSGIDVQFLKTWRLDTTTRTYELSGTATGLLHGWYIATATGTYTLAGQDVTLTYEGGAGGGASILAATGALTLAGSDVTLTRNVPLGADTQTYSVEGVATGLLWHRVLAATTQTYLVTGNEVTLTKGIPLAATTQSYEVSGQDVSFIWSHYLAVAKGSFVIAFPTTRLTYSGDPIVPDLIIKSYTRGRIPTVLLNRRDNPF